MSAKKRTIGVIGLGNFGSTVATELTRFGNYVIGVDLNQQRVSNHVERLSQAVIADARDDIALREAGLADCDMALVAMGSDLESSILSAINLKLLGVETI